MSVLKYWQLRCKLILGQGGMLPEEHSGETSHSSVKSPRLRLVVETLPCGAVKLRAEALN
jgi:hypothetical protein